MSRLDELESENLSYKVLLDGLKKQIKHLRGEGEDRSQLIADARQIVSDEHAHMKGTTYHLSPPSQMIERLIAEIQKTVKETT